MEERITIVIKQEKMEFAYIDNILTGNEIDVDGNFVGIGNTRLFEITKNDNKIRGHYFVKLAYAYVDDKTGDICVDLTITKEEVSTKTRIINSEKYVKTNAYKYISKNYSKMMSNAIHKVEKTLCDNNTMLDIIEDKFNRTCDNDLRTYLLKYLNTQLGQPGKVYASSLSRTRQRAYFYNRQINQPDLELRIMFVNYINLHHLTGIVFIEPKDLDYVRSIGEEFENSKHRHKEEREFFKEFLDNKEDEKGEDGSNDESDTASLLAAYCYIENDNAVRNIQKHFNFEDDRFDIGKYIFVCAESIDDFIKNDIAKLYSKKQPMCFDENDLNCTQKCPFYKGEEKIDVVESVIKLIFLHEVGHMAFTNCSTKNKIICNETLANWFASLCVKTYAEKCMIREMTKFQPIEYKYYFTNPNEQKGQKIKIFEDENDIYNDACSIFRTLKFGIIDIYKYYDMIECLINYYMR